MILKQVRNHLKQIALSSFPFTAIVNDNFLFSSGEHHVRTNSQEGVAANLLPAFDGFKQEGVLFSFSQTQESRDRGLQIGSHGFDDRNQRCSLREAFEFFAIWAEHGSSCGE